MEVNEWHWLATAVTPDGLSVAPRHAMVLPTRTTLSRATQLSGTGLTAHLLPTSLAVVNVVFLGPVL